MIITVSYGQLALIVMHLILVIGGISSFKGVATGMNDNGIGFMIWCGIGVVLEILIWLIYFSGMYLLS